MLSTMLSFWCHNCGWVEGRGGGVMSSHACLVSCLRSCQYGHTNKHWPTHWCPVSTDIFLLFTVLSHYFRSHQSALLEFGVNTENLYMWSSHNVIFKVKCALNSCCVFHKSVESDIQVRIQVVNLGIEGFFRIRRFTHEFSKLLLQLVFRWGDAST